MCVRDRKKRAAFLRSEFLRVQSCRLCIVAAFYQTLWYLFPDYLYIGIVKVG